VSRTLAACLASALGFACGDPPVVQPIPFNHQIHLGSVGLQCDACHERAYTHRQAGIPRVDLCLGCHAGDVTENPAALRHVELLRRRGAEGREVEWKRVYRLPRHVFFSHRRHTELGKLECSACHGDMARLAAPPERPVEEALSMDGCMDCHEKLGVENECAWCHR
jgi:hypothetical protein